jgi:pimeloyl-ACP methyl ester carboxylesterase
VLTAAGLELGSLHKPALVVWGVTDPYIPARFGRDYAVALGARELIELPDAGHWPWLDRPDILDTIAHFLGAGPD